MYHLQVLPILRSLHKVYGPISVIHFVSSVARLIPTCLLILHKDAHIDTWPDYEGVITEQSRVTHGTFFTLAFEEGLMSNSSIHAGIRNKLEVSTRHCVAVRASC